LFFTGKAGSELAKKTKKYTPTKDKDNVIELKNPESFADDLLDGFVTNQGSC